jgi:hypothetical protein
MGRKTGLKIVDKKKKLLSLSGIIELKILACIFHYQAVTVSEVGHMDEDT